MMGKLFLALSVFVLATLALVAVLIAGEPDRIVPINTVPAGTRPVEVYDRLGLARISSFDWRRMKAGTPGARADEIFWTMDNYTWRRAGSDVDIYSILGTSNQVLNVKFRPEKASQLLKYEMRFLNSLGQSIQKFTAPAPSLTVTLKGEGPWYISVHSVRGSTGTRYRLLVEPIGGSTVATRTIQEREPNDILETAQRVSPGDTVQGDLTLIPDSRWSNDAYSGYQWDLEAMNAPATWTLDDPDDDVVAVVVDTGVDTEHPDLVDALYTLPGEIPGNGIDDNGDGCIDNLHSITFLVTQRDCIGDAPDPFGHGTHVAGSIAASVNNRIGIAGMAASRVKLLSVRVFNSGGYGSLSDILKGLNAVAAWKDDLGVPVVVTNNSWGTRVTRGTDYERDIVAVMSQAFGALSNRGIYHAVSAGNSGVDMDTSPAATYPAELPSPWIITVAATTSFDTLAWFSNYGRQTVEIGAPGFDIFSTGPGGVYYLLSGTSMAAPHIAGALAAFLARHPDADPGELRRAMRESTRPLDALANKTLYGGILDLDAFLRH